ncbi:MAG: hypothetical protein K6G54_07370 [Oscillospiraceae bacterium]|nr:hypothetical protein [Oscillospiraceae bacterium]
MPSPDKTVFLNEMFGGPERSSANALLVFKAMEGVEAEYGVDFTMLPLETLQEVFSRGVFGARASNATLLLQQALRYARWRRDKGLPCGEGIFQVTADTGLGVRRTMVSSSAHLAAVLDQVFEPASTGSADVLYRAWLWFAFSGLPERYSVLVAAAQLDFNAMEIRGGVRRYPIAREAVCDLRRAATAQSLIVNRSLASGAARSSEYRRRGGNVVLRGTLSGPASESDAIDIGTLRARVSRRFHEVMLNHEHEDAPPTCIAASYKSIRTSGQFARLYDLERMGVPIDFRQIAGEEFALRQSGDKPYKLSRGVTENAIVNRIARFTRQDYERWKQAFTV